MWFRWNCWNIFSNELRTLNLLYCESLIEISKNPKKQLTQEIEEILLKKNLCLILKTVEMKLHNNQITKMKQNEYSSELIVDCRPWVKTGSNHWNYKGQSDKGGYCHKGTKGRIEDSAEVDMLNYTQIQREI